ncbi:MAG: hypothetical protein HKN22_02035, partial [Bacteroidia bacterium]|nr:hypothetical protein [Bacteroidia bacterium]
MKGDQLRFWLLLSTGLTFFIAIVLCIRTTVEPDIWWQIRTGEYILQNLEVPYNDVFSYTYSEVRWINVKWLSEVLMSLVANSIGAESLFLLQMFVLIGILITFFQIPSIKINQNLNLKIQQTPAFFFSILLFLIAFSFRINARPEMFSHLFTAIYCLLFWYYLHNRRSYVLLLLIPGSILWANIHEAYGVGIVFWIIVAVGRAIELYFKNDPQKTWKNWLYLSAIIVCCFLCSAISPNGTAMWLKPINIIDQLGENQFTTELIPFTET